MSGNKPVSSQTQVMSFSIARHFVVGNYHPRKTFDNLVALHRSKKFLVRTFAITLRSEAVEARKLVYTKM